MQFQPPLLQPSDYRGLRCHAPVLRLEGQTFDEDLPASGGRSHGVEGEVGRDSRPQTLGPSLHPEGFEEGLGVHLGGLRMDGDLSGDRLERELGELRNLRQGAEGNRGPQARRAGIGVDPGGRQLDDPLRRVAVSSASRTGSTGRISRKSRSAVFEIEGKASRGRECPALGQGAGEGSDADILAVCGRFSMEGQEGGACGREFRLRWRPAGLSHDCL